MSDFLLQLGQNPRARRMIKRLGLPIPVPQALRRASGPWQDRPLTDETIVFAAAPGGHLAPMIAKTLAAAGANPHVVGEMDAAFRDLGQAYGRPATALDPDALPDRFRARALVFDASGITTIAELAGLYEFFHPLVGALEKCARVVVLGTDPAGAETPEAAAAQTALEGFVRSAGKELGRKGSTSHLLRVAVGAEARLEGPLRWLLSRRSAFVTCQPITLSADAKADPEPAWVRPLEGKVALVTGAARGIGAATARLLAAEGAKVVCLDRPADSEPLGKVARDIGGVVLLLDVTDENAPDILADELGEKHGGVDIVVHNAGVTRDKTLARMKPAQWNQTLDINLAAVCRITDALAQRDVLADGARIICLSSVAGIAGNVGQTNYAASKAGIVGYVRGLAPTLAARGITVNAIAPGFIETRLTAAIPVMIREAGRRLSALGQGGRPVDVGEAITFLASPGAAGITGTVLRVCGGALIGA